MHRTKGFLKYLSSHTITANRKPWTVLPSRNISKTFSGASEVSKSKTLNLQHITPRQKLKLLNFQVKAQIN